MSKTTRYRLSLQYQILEKDCITDASSPVLAAVAAGESVLLFDKASDSHTLLHADMASLLHRFSVPLDFDTLVRQLAAELSEKMTAVRAVVRPFFVDMVDKGVLLTEKKFNQLNDNRIQELPVGTLIGNYRLERQLSFTPPVGIYQAVDIQNGQKVALKFLYRPSFLSVRKWGEWKKDFSKEFKILKLLRGGKNVVQLLEKADNYAVTAWFEGKSLNKMMNSEVVFPLKTRLDWLTQIIEGFDFIHQKGVIHGDIHSSNILINEADNQIQIIDFDLAQAQGEQLIENEFEGGEYEFMPPERIADDVFRVSHQTPGFRSDVYQLGIISYLIVYGKLPFTAPKWRELANAIKNNDLHIPDKYKENEEVSPKLLSFLRQCLAKSPENRFPSASELHANWQQIIMANSFN
jgi:Protein kinase domain